MATDLLYIYRTVDSDVALMAMAQNYPSGVDSWHTRLCQRLFMRYGEAFRRMSKRCSLVDVMMFLCLTPLVLPNVAFLWITGSEVSALLGRMPSAVGYPPTLSIEMASITILGRREYQIVCIAKFRDDAWGRSQIRGYARHTLRVICEFIIESKDVGSYHYYYNYPILEAARLNAYEVVETIVAYFPNAIWSENEDGHNIIQYAVINRSEQVYNLLYQMSEHKNIYRTIKDSFGNNLLHLAGRLAPSNKLNLISGAALQIQRELQWYKEVESFVSPLSKLQKNSFGETPQMVFTREHKDLVIEGENWMKTTAESYTITAALIITIVFAAAITVPGGSNQDTGIPVFTNDIAFTVFAISDAISLFTSATSLLMFLSILTARFAEQDFLFSLPLKLIIGLATLFISTTAMIVAFGATLFLVFGQRKPWIIGPIVALTCLPIASFVTLQFPLIADLVRATFGRSIFGKKRDHPFY